MDDAGPRHRITLTSKLFLSKYDSIEPSITFEYTVEPGETLQAAYDRAYPQAEWLWWQTATRLAAEVVPTLNGTFWERAQAYFQQHREPPESGPTLGQRVRAARQAAGPLTTHDRFSE